MTKQLPDCKDFIITALRTIRRNPTNLKANTAAGVGLKRLWSVASEIYEEPEFRNALKELLEQKVLIASWTTSSRKAGSGSGPFREEVITEIPPNMDLSKGWMYRSVNGDVIEIDNRDTIDHDSFYGTLLYVIADGLPGKFNKASKKTAGARAAQILETMRSK
jgi:hypothetical protein